MKEMKELTIPELAIPRSRPSSNVQALHRALLDMYPHRWHVSVSSMRLVYEKKRTEGGSVLTL
jgi:hypothetical protein